MQTQFRFKTDDTLICYFPNGNIIFDKSGEVSLSRKEPQKGDTCWYDGSMMFANLLVRDLSDNDKLKIIKQYKEETEALFFLKYCFEQIINQFSKDKLIQLYSHPNILSINFPNDFREYLSIAINSTERKKIFFDHLAKAIKDGNSEAKKSLVALFNKLKFDAGSRCLENIGLKNIADNIKQTNSFLEKNLQNGMILQIMQKDSIIDSIFEILTITKCEKPSGLNELYNLLEKSGPLLARGTFGIDCYRPATEKRLSVIQDMHILGWNKEDYVEDKDRSAHATIIVGVKYDNKKPELSRIFFLDPRQTLNPYEKNIKIYSANFSKFMSHTKEVHLLSGYNLTEKKIQAIEGKNKVPELSQSNLPNTLLSLRLSIGAFKDLSDELLLNAAFLLSSNDMRRFRSTCLFFAVNPALKKLQQERIVEERRMKPF